jgi:hypothetical protein
MEEEGPSSKEGTFPVTFQAGSHGTLHVKGAFCDWKCLSLSCPLSKQEKQKGHLLGGGA